MTSFNTDKALSIIPRSWFSNIFIVARESSYALWAIEEAYWGSPTAAISVSSEPINLLFTFGFTFLTISATVVLLLSAYALSALIEST